MTATRHISDNIADYIHYLTVTIGPRPGASAANQRAREYIAASWENAGWQVEVQEFDCPDWTHRETRLIWNGRELTAAANAYSPACQVTAPVAAAATIAELAATDMNGRLGLLYGDLTRAPLAPKSWFLKSEREDEIIRLLEEKQPAALMTVQGDTSGLERIIEDWEFTIPSATISAAAGRELLLATDPSATLIIDAEMTAGRTGNVVARSGSGQRRAVICAHYDTKIETPGALDNAAGTAVLLALAQVLNSQEYPFSLELVAFTNEEYMPIGDDEYLRRDKAGLEKVEVAINIDLAGQLLAPNAISIYTASDDFNNAVESIAADFQGLVWVDPWPESNHSTFAWRGVPSLAFSSSGGLRPQHKPEDVLEWISPARLAELVIIIGRILDDVAQQPFGWTRSHPGNN